MDEIFTVDLTLTTKRLVDGEEFVNFCGLFKKYELYILFWQISTPTPWLTLLLVLGKSRVKKNSC